MVTRLDEEPKRSRTLWPLPGGAGHYLESLARIALLVADEEDLDHLLDAVVGDFSQVTSRKAARSYVEVTKTLGFVEGGSATARLTPTGERFLETRDPQLVREALFGRVAGVSELVSLIEERPRRIGLLHEAMGRRGFGEWRTDKQIRHRLRWLEETGAVSKRGRGRPEYHLAASEDDRR